MWLSPKATSRFPPETVTEVKGYWPTDPISHSTHTSGRVSHELTLLGRVLPSKPSYFVLEK